MRGRGRGRGKGKEKIVIYERKRKGKIAIYERKRKNRDLWAACQPLLHNSSAVYHLNPFTTKCFKYRANH